MAYSAGVTATLMMIIITTFISTSSAEIRSFDIRSDSRRIIKLDEFGFTNNGRIKLNVTNLSFSSSTDAIDLSKLGFLLSTSPWPEYNKIDCALEFNITKQVYNLSSLPKGATSFNHYFMLSHADQYTLVFANCLPREVKVRVLMNVRSSMYNLNKKSNKRDYLSVGMTILPMVYFSLSLIYLTIVLVWVFVLYKKRLNVSGIHYFMLAVVILKALNMIFEAVDKSYIKQTGTPLIWEHVVLYILCFLNGITFFTLSALIACWWKPKLEVKDKMFVMIVILIQVIANIALVAIDERGSFAAQGWVEFVFWLAYLICCSLVFLNFLNAASNLDKEVAVTIGPKKAFLLVLSKLINRYFYAFVVYLSLRNVVLLSEGGIFYKYVWVRLVVLEVLALAFYGFTGYSFIPCDFAVDDDNDLEAATSQQNMNI